MYSPTRLLRREGFTLIEAIIALVIMTIGILAVMTMQINAIQGNATSLNRSDATNIANALLETLKELDFNDANLNQTETNLTTIIRDTDDSTFTSAAFPELSGLLQFPAASVAGTVVNNTGKTYQLSWDVNDTLATGDPTKILYKTIQVHMVWNAAIGQNHLDITTVKYNNIKL